MDGNRIIAVQVDRCWNRNWRCLMFASIIVMSFIVAALFFSERRARLDGLLETDWQDHWSQKDESQKASKIIFEKGPAGNGGINVQSHEETLEDYFEKEFDEEAVYDPDNHYNPRLPENLNPETRLNKDYVEQYAHEVKSAQSLRSVVPSAYTNRSLAGNRTVSVLSSFFTANIKDYTLQSNFQNPFRDLTEEDIEFDADYTNPCWAESIPRYPYVNNSYLRVSELARQIDPEFQSMRKRFAARHDPATNWRLRCLPAFYVMETPPMATPSLFTVLGYHPSVVTPRLQEPEFWNKRGPDGVATLRDYVDLFDSSAQAIRDSVEQVKVDDKVYMKHNRITGDGTSSYLWMFDSWKKVKGNEGETQPKVTAADIIYKLTPLAKFIFVLRDPSERLFQSYLSRAVDPSAAEFHTQVGEAMKKMSKCEESRSLWSCLTDRSFNHILPARLRIGMYYPFIADWLRVFPRNQIMVVRFEDYVSRPSEIISDVCHFLEIPPFQAEEGQGLEERVKITEDERLAELADHTIMSATQAMLKEFHRKLNAELAALLEDDKFTWPESSSVPSSSVLLQNSELYEDIEETDKEEQKKMKEDTAKKIKEERERQVAEQHKKLNEYMEKRKQWAVQQYELQQKIVDKQQELLKEKQKQQQEGQQQPQPGQQQQQGQPRREGQEQEQQLRQQEQQQRRKQPPGQQQPQQGRPGQQQ